MDAADLDVIMGKNERKEANKVIVDHLQQAMTDGMRELAGLRLKLSNTYWVIIALSLVMFFIGCILLCVPFLAALNDQITALQSAVAAGFGIADLAALFLFRPLDNIHKIMGDMSQMILSLNSFQTQLGLRLWEMDATKRESIGQTAVLISAAAKDSIKLIEKYFEVGEIPKKVEAKENVIVPAGATS